MVDEQKSQAERIVKKIYILYRFIILAVKKSFNLLTQGQKVEFHEIEIHFFMRLNS